MKISPVSISHQRTNFGIIAKNESYENQNASKENHNTLAKISKDNYIAYVNLTKEKKQQNISAIANETMQYVKSMGLKSQTKMELENPFIKYTPTGEYKELVDKMSYIHNIRRGKSIDDFVATTLKIVPAMGVGNCSEQAILVADYLINSKNIDNVALVAATIKGQDPFDPNAEDQHVFVVTGLAQDAEIDNPKTWGEEAIIIDPWANILAPAESDNPGISGLNKLYMTFRTKLMTFENYSNYIDPTHDKDSKFNWENHKKISTQDKAS